MCIRDRVSTQSTWDMESSKRIMITGSNKGVGYGILENLATRPEKHRFIMAVRNAALGKAAVQELEKTIPGLSDRVKILEVDISKSESIDKFIKELSEAKEQIDCLVNNAGTAYHGDIFNEEVVRVTFQTNFYGTVEFTEKMLPYIVDGGKIVFVTSSGGKLGRLPSEELKKKFTSPDINKEKIFALAKKFYDDVVANTYEKEGWPKQAYCMSKLHMNIYIRWFANTETILKRGIQVYSCCPGWVRTDMAGPKATRSIQEGSICPSDLVCFPYKIDPEKQGKFFYDSVVTPIDQFIQSNSSHDHTQ
eukprot:TRINITY_DN64895_c0_g1_i3.p1 TRINITY_DN64895_c0_g1~~TRINITY_DN64895_c0_g1_i3.p1  ORF type:complete len:306 (+),score=49.79 TRINITY_DN64895_c0_g1_i3:146-1063(+)